MVVTVTRVKEGSLEVSSNLKSIFQEGTQLFFGSRGVDPSPTLHDSLQNLDSY